MNTIHKYPELLEPASVLRAAQPEASVPLRRNRLKPTIDCFTRLQRLPSDLCTPYLACIILRFRVPPCMT